MTPAVRAVPGLRRNSLALLAALAALAPACRAERGVLYRCRCPFDTDFDEVAQVEVEVCAPDDERAGPTGRGCAQSGAPGSVQSCACQPSGPAGSCEVGACRLITE